MLKLSDNRKIMEQLFQVVEVQFQVNATQDLNRVKDGVFY